MTVLTTLVPSRGRPEAAWELCEHRSVVFVVDQDDETQPQYPPSRTLVVEGGSMVRALNQAAAQVETPYVGFMGDDHRPRTPHWEDAVVNILRTNAERLGAAIVYGDDLLQGRNLPTAAWMTRNLVEAIGFMTPPVLRHLYVDNYWLELGVRLGAIEYAPQLIVEHMHPVAGKSKWTPGHLRVNALDTADRAAYEEFRRGPLGFDAALQRARTVMKP